MRLLCAFSRRASAARLLCITTTSRLAAVRCGCGNFAAVSIIIA